MNFTRTTHTPMQHQRGAAFMVMLVIMIVGIAAFLVSSLSSSALQTKRDEVTASALVQAREALIGYATSVDLTGVSRPGDLPCPDTDNDGIAGSTSPLVLTCDLQSQRIGRLPWKTLGLPDLRDGNGERLWYAVSDNFKNNTRTICTVSGQPGCLNSDTAGTITVRGSNGSIIYNGCSAFGLPDCPNPSASDAPFGTGAVAIIFSAGDVLTRQGAASIQNRGCTVGMDCDTTEKCTMSPPTLTPKCNPVNYLDIATAEDNADFADSSSTNGFIQGRIKDLSNNVILNDQLLVITQDSIMQVIQKRVAGEVKQCLNEYAIHPQNMGRYPWAVPPADFPSYSDISAKLFGRIPDTPFTQTCLSSGGNTTSVPPNTNNCSDTPTTGMKNNWTGNCNINSLSGWWLNWKEMVFYGLSDAYKPTTPLIAPACGTTGTCLSVTTPSVIANQKFVVIVAGKMLTNPVAQARSSSPQKSTPDNYLELPNNFPGTTTFAQSGVSATFNDTLVFQ